MAGEDSNLHQEMVESEEERLKYLEFVQVAAFSAVVYFSRLYGYAKENSGPLKPGVQSVEGTVKTIVGPVYNRFHDVPIELLKFVDRKVDESINKVESSVPPKVKQVSAQAFSAAQKAPEATSEVLQAGVVNTASEMAKNMYAKCEPVAKDVYIRYEPVAEQYAASAWRSLNRLPLFPKVAQAVVVPTATYCSEKYNQTVIYSAEQGYKISSYLPLVPTKRIAKVFRAGGSESKPLVPRRIS